MVDFTKILRKISARLSLTVFIAASVLSLAFKLYISQIGYNPDIESWWLVKEAVVADRSVYISTHRYNYGPIWSYILHIFGNFIAGTPLDSIQGLHYVVSGFLGLVDISIAIVMLITFGLMPALAFLLSPLGFLLSGYHSQFDNVALFFALVSYELYRKSFSVKDKKHENLVFFASALVLGFSLSVKHILFLFPFWLLLSCAKSIKQLMRHFAYVFISYALFILYFVQEIMLNWDNKSGIANGIRLFVIEYKGSYGVSALLNLLSNFFPISMIDQFFANTPVFKGYMFFFVCLILLVGYAVREAKFDKTRLLIYLLAFFSLSTSMADQYIAIALIPLAVFMGSPIAPITLLMTFIYLAGPLSANFGGLIQFPLMLGTTNKLYGLFPWNLLLRIGNITAQAWFIALFVSLGLSLRYSIVKFSRFAFGFLTVFLVINLAMLLSFKYTSSKNHQINVLDIQDETICADLVNEIAVNSCNNKSECNLLLDLEDCSGKYRIFWSCSEKYTLYPVSFVDFSLSSLKSEIFISCKNRFFY